MGTIYFDDKDIKESKIALVNQKITPLQSAFLMQYITNLEEQLQQQEDIINKLKECIKENTVGKKYGEEYYIDEFDRFARPSNLLEILDNKGE